jgi:hypothetical protein
MKLTTVPMPFRVPGPSRLRPGTDTQGEAPLFRCALPWMLSLLLLGCGEFHTQQYYQEVTGTDAADAASCNQFVTLLLSGPATITARQYDPLVFAVLASGADQEILDWTLSEGRLPSGLHLAVGEGTVSGFPVESGTFDATILVSADREKYPCIQGAEHKVTVTVQPGCTEESDCPEAADGTWEVLCAAPGRCLLGGYDEVCEGGYGGLYKWTLQNAPEPLPEVPWRVVGHVRMTAAERSAPKLGVFTHRITFTDDGEATWSLLYRLVPEWPLPFADGDEVRIHALHDGEGDTGGLALEGPEGARPVFLHDGPLDQALLDGVAAAGLFPPLTATRHALACKPAEDPHQCGPRGHDLLEVAAAEATPVRLGTGQSGVLALEDARTIVHVGCFNLPPTWASFMLFPEASCPVARVADPGTLQPLLQAGQALPVVLDASGSFAHGDRHVVSYEWVLESQPYPGLVALVHPGAGKDPQGFYKDLFLATAAGSYAVRLDVVDDSGARSCAAALAQVDARVSIDVDLWVEAVWWTPDDTLALDQELDILVMHPTYNSILGPTPWTDGAWAVEANDLAHGWVCGEENPAPHHWEALPEDEASHCRVSGGDLSDGRPEVISVATLDRDKKTDRYPIALRAPSTNTKMVFGNLRVFVEGKPMYETSRRGLQPGQTWHAGHIDVEFMKFVPEKNGK